MYAENNFSFPLCALILFYSMSLPFLTNLQPISYSSVETNCMFDMIIQEKATEPAASQCDTVFKCNLFLISLLHSCLNILHF